jgi:glycosyltransferase involved in cell wall biosynthesis
MRLLICTQAVDRNDPILSFFHGWIQEFAKRAECVHIICLKEGDHDLPSNVSVHSLGKEKKSANSEPSFAQGYGRARQRTANRMQYASRFYFLVWKYRKQYDAVFVHMNQEYVLLAWKLWWIFRKRVILWRNHGEGSWHTRLAGRLVHTVCYTSPDAYVASFKNAVRMPIGIDTKVFMPRGKAGDASSVLFLGRLDAAKNPDIFLQALALLSKDGIKFRANVYGDPTPGREEYANELRERYAHINSVSLHPGVRNDQTPAIYTEHAIYVNLTPSGSFDKTIGEAMSSGCVVVAGNEALRGILPDKLLVKPRSTESVARGITEALRMDEASRERLRARVREYVEREHSLSLLASRLAALYKTSL